MVQHHTHLIKPILGAQYPEVQYGEGIYLYDTSGKQYLDGSSGAMTASIGHGVKEIRDAMYEQAEKISYVFRGQFTSRPAEELADILAEEAPGDLDWSFFVNSGSEANENALRIAIQYWQEKGKPQKNCILSRWMSYHGVTLGALSMSGNMTRRERYESLLRDFPAVVPPYSYRPPVDAAPESLGVALANDLERAILEVGAENIAAFIMEPVIGSSGGAIVPPSGYHERIREICDHYEVLLIADEMVTGLGRTGKMFALQHWNIQPDLMSLGKGLGGAMTAIGATMVSDRMIKTIENGSKMMMSGHTLSANPQATATSLATLHYIKNNHLAGNAAYQGEILKKGLYDLANRYSLIGDVRGLGLLCGLEFVCDKETKQPFDLRQQVTNRIIQKGYEYGLILYNAAGGMGGTAGDAILITPPLVISTEEVQELLNRLDAVMHDISSELSSEGQLASRSIS